jgi:hypothetical protein
MAWQYFYGAYNNTGPYANVVLGGSPDNTGPFGVPLATAHASGYGKGINFIDNGNYGVTFILDLVGYAITDDQQYVEDGYYIGDTSVLYNYFIIVSKSTDNQGSWTQLLREKIFTHTGQVPLNYRLGWDNTARASQWSKFIQLSNDTTHVKIELQGEDATFPHSNIYSINQVIPDFRPWGIRKSGVLKSLNNDSGFLKIRKSNSWKDIPKYSYDKAGKENQGTSRILKNGKWLGQRKIGN